MNHPAAAAAAATTSASRHRQKASIDLLPHEKRWFCKVMQARGRGLAPSAVGLSQINWCVASLAELRVQLPITLVHGRFTLAAMALRGSTLPHCTMSNWYNRARTTPADTDVWAAATAEEVYALGPR